MSTSSFFALPKTETTSGHSVITNAWGPTRCTQVCVDTRTGDYPVLCAKRGAVTVPFPTRVGMVSSMRVLSCEIPATFRQYSASSQNTTFSVGDGQMVTVPDRNWTAVELTTYLSSISGTNLSFAYDADTNRVSMTNIGVSGDPVAVSFSCSPHSVFERTRLKNRLGWCMGFRRPEYVVPGGGTVFAEGAFVEKPTSVIYLRVVDNQSSSENSMTVCSFSSDSTILARITTDATDGTMFASTINGRLISGTRKYSGKTDLDRVTVELVDGYGNPVATDTDFSVCLEMVHM